MKFINMLKDHAGWITFGFVLCALTPILMVLLGVSITQALYLALCAITAFCVVFVVWTFIKMIRNSIYWRMNH